MPAQRHGECPVVVAQVCHLPAEPLDLLLQGFDLLGLPPLFPLGLRGQPLEGGRLRPLQLGIIIDPRSHRTPWEWFDRILGPEKGVCHLLRHGSVHDLRPILRRTVACQFLLAPANNSRRPRGFPVYKSVMIGRWRPAIRTRQKSCWPTRPPPRPATAASYIACTGTAPWSRHRAQRSA